MFVTIVKISETSYSVKGEGRSFSGFGSYYWAQRWCEETMGYVIWDDPDAEEAQQ